MSEASDLGHMTRAVELAERGLYTCDPNPRVGCVLVNGGRVVGEGWHERAGGPHAERMALERATDHARGATAYVTLAPCAHTGRTGPCTAALIEAGVRRVVCAMEDPDPISGSGVTVLRENGIRVELGLLAEVAAALNPGYLARHTVHRPFVRSKLAASLDGRTALADGQSRWITGPEARADVHRWRARSSAVLTGIGTVLADNPRLDARIDEPDRAVMQPRRIILDSALKTPPQAQTLSLPGEVSIFTTKAPTQHALQAQGARIELVGGTPHCDLHQVMNRLAELEVNEVWVEAGPSLNGALLTAQLVDQLVVYLAPQLLGDTARGMFSLGPFGSLDERVMLEYRDVHRVGPDLRIIARPSTVASP